MVDTWYRFYVACFLTPQKIALPTPIPTKIKEYLTGTFRLYWLWTGILTGVFFTTVCMLLGALLYQQKAPLYMVLHSMGTISFITTVFYFAWSLSYYLYSRQALNQDLKHILRNKLY